jgi:hypothetical protein
MLNRQFNRIPRFNTNQTFELRANSGPTSDGAKPYFMVSWTSSTIKLVHETTKYGLAPFEVGPEFALNLPRLQSITSAASSHEKRTRLSQINGHKWCAPTYSFNKNTKK